MTACEILAFLVLALLAVLFKIHDWRTIEVLRNHITRQSAELLAQNRELTRLIAASKGVPAVNQYVERAQGFGQTPDPVPQETLEEMPYES